MDDFKGQIRRKPNPNQGRRLGVKINVGRGNTLRVKSFVHQKPGGWQSWWGGNTSENADQGNEQPEARTISPRSTLRRAVSLLLLTFALLTTGGIFWEAIPFFTQPLTFMTLEGHRLLTTKEVYEQSQLKYGMRLSEIDPYMVGQDLDQHPVLESAQARKVFPNRLYIHLEERIPYAYLRTKNYYYVIDRQQRPLLRLEQKQFPGLPVFSGVEKAPYELGQPIASAGLEKGLRFLDLLRTSQSFALERLAEINVADPLNLKVVLAQEGITLFLGEAHYPERLQRFEAIYPQLRQKAEAPRLIDLRYEQQFIVEY